MIEGMNHFTILGEDEAQTLDFYVGLLGLTAGPRPWQGQTAYRIECGIF